MTRTATRPSNPAAGRHGLGLDGATESIAVEGEPGRALCDLAAERGPPSSSPERGRGGLKRAVLGSVSDHLVRNAPCPVLVAGAQ